jgi:hypothetical protein
MKSERVRGSAWRVLSRARTDLVAVDDLPFIKEELFDSCQSGRLSSYGNCLPAVMPVRHHTSNINVTDSLSMLREIEIDISVY